MNNSVFTTIISELWQSLELGTADFSPDSSTAYLSVENVDLILRHGETGEFMIIECNGGTLNQNPGDDLRELETILKLNLALNLTHDTVTTLHETKTQKHNLRFFSYYSYETNSLQKISEKISDIVSAAETYFRITNTMHSTREQTSENLSNIQEDFLVFQP